MPPFRAPPPPPLETSEDTEEARLRESSDSLIGLPRYGFLSVPLTFLTDVEVIVFSK